MESLITQAEIQGPLTGSPHSSQRSKIDATETFQKSHTGLEPVPGFHFQGSSHAQINSDLNQSSVGANNNNRNNSCNIFSTNLI